MAERKKEETQEKQEKTKKQEQYVYLKTDFAFWIKKVHSESGLSFRPKPVSKDKGEQEDEGNHPKQSGSDREDDSRNSSTSTVRIYSPGESDRERGEGETKPLMNTVLNLAETTFESWIVEPDGSSNGKGIAASPKSVLETICAVLLQRRFEAKSLEELEFVDEDIKILRNKFQSDVNGPRYIWRDGEYVPRTSDEGKAKLTKSEKVEIEPILFRTKRERIIHKRILVCFNELNRTCQSEFLRFHGNLRAALGLWGDPSASLDETIMKLFELPGTDERLSLYVKAVGESGLGTTPPPDRAIVLRRCIEIALHLVDPAQLAPTDSEATREDTIQRAYSWKPLGAEVRNAHRDKRPFSSAIPESLDRTKLSKIGSSHPYDIEAPDDPILWGTSERIARSFCAKGMADGGSLTEPFVYLARVWLSRLAIEGVRPTAIIPKGIKELERISTHEEIWVQFSKDLDDAISKVEEKHRRKVSSLGFQWQECCKGAPTETEEALIETRLAEIVDLFHS
ncbi:MAG: hypothetical protein SFX72_09880 [Isosphaeraceae bacterium]|nr:hypothetical protein [Isosphaeraceae bacterium]